jgi:uncharacterized membrane protein
MESKAKFLGHSIHQMLIIFPLGLLVTTVVFDFIYIVSGSIIMAEVAHWMIAAGIVGGLIAAPFGWIDWFSVPKGTPAKSIGLWHGVGNVLVLLLFMASWFLRRDFPENYEAALMFSFAGAAATMITGWLGGESVDRLGVGVEDDANPNAPSSFSKSAGREQLALKRRAKV